jgi:PAS domain-containing protein
VNVSPTDETSKPKQDAETLHEQREWLRVTLSSIGDAVITTDTKGSITYLNSVAVSLIARKVDWVLDWQSSASSSRFRRASRQDRQTHDEFASFA